MSSFWFPRRRPPASLRCPWRLSAAALALVLAGSASAWASPCGSLTFTFSDTFPAPTLFMEPDESSLRVSGQMQISADGSRAMQNTFWSTSYRVLPDGADENGITGESYWATGAQSPVLDLEFQRDSNGRVAREILWSPPPPDSISPGGRWRVVGWYQYLRNSEGLLIQIIYHFHWGQDDRPLSDDDPILSRVDIDYGLGYHTPREAMIFYRSLARTSVRFDYDTSGRLTGGFRQGPWPSYFSVTNGACEAAPERLFVILLAPHGGPWYPFEGSSRRGLRPGSPR